MATVSQIRIKDATQMSGYSDRDIGAQAINVTVGYDSKGNIITNKKTSPVTEKNVAEALVDGLDPISHASNSDKYGVASKAQYGHVKIGEGIDVSDGVVSVNYGNNAGTSCQGNDSRLSDDRPNPEVITFSDGTTKVEYDGSEKVDITLATLDGAPSAHTSVIADANTLGHVKLSDNYTGTTTESGVAASSAGLQAAYTAINTYLTELKKSVSDGKSTVASAITAKGVSTTSDATFATMATNIKNIPNANSGTYTPTSRSASLDMGVANTYRYVNTNSVPNTNSATYTPSSNGSALDMGATNTYRYVNTNTVYNSGYNSGYATAKIKIKQVATGGYSGSVNIKSIYSNWASLTVDNFAVIPLTTYGAINTDYAWNTSVSANASYSYSNGIFTWNTGQAYTQVYDYKRQLWAYLSSVKVMMYYS